MAQKIITWHTHKIAEGQYAGRVIAFLGNSTPSEQLAREVFDSRAKAVLWAKQTAMSHKRAATA